MDRFVEARLKAEGQRLTQGQSRVEAPEVSSFFENKLVWTVDDVAKELFCSTRHVKRLVSRDEIPYSRIGRLVRFSPSKVHSWLSKGGTR